MKEAKPLKVNPAKGMEPTLRVGIVLKEDHKNTLRFMTPDEKYTLSFENKKIALTPNTRYTLRHKHGQIELHNMRDEVLAQTAAVVSLTPAQPMTLAPGKGLEISEVTVGRGFHWQKTLAETISGGFEASLDGGEIVLINTIAFEDYLACVLSSEMNPVCPPEFCKAQVTAARSWAMVFLGHKHTGTPYTICNDDDCQRYRGTTDLNQAAIDAVKHCRGEFLIDAEGFVCPAYYSKSCGGHIELAQHTFGFEVPGLGTHFDCVPVKAPSLNLARQGDFSKWLDPRVSRAAGVFCLAEELADDELMKYLSSVDVKGTYYRWEHTFTAKELIINLRDKFGVTGIDEIIDILPGERGVSGRITTLMVVYKDKQEKRISFLLEDQYNIRRALHKSFLYSSAFDFMVQRGENGAIQKINLEGCGWGHGVGLCQIGALVMGLRGYKYHDILKHYYPGTTIQKSYR